MSPAARAPLKGRGDIRLEPNLPLAIVAGALSSVACGIFFVFLSPALGLRRVDYPYLLGQLEYPEGTLSVALGWLVFVFGGIAFALLYANYLHDRLPSPNWLQGLLFGGLGIFVVSSVVFFPLMGFHPLVRSGKLPAPGFFGFGLSGWAAVLTNFLGHCLYGVTLGGIYRRKFMFSSS